MNGEYVAASSPPVVAEKFATANNNHRHIINSSKVDKNIDQILSGCMVNSTKP